VTRRLAMLSIFASLNAAAQPLALVNPSFEQSLDGWSTFPPDGPGLASVIDPFVYGARPVRAPHGTPNHGHYHSFLTTGAICALCSRLRYDTEPRRKEPGEW